LDERELYEFECIYLDIYNPLKGFLKKQDYSSVVRRCCLYEEPGIIWSLPVTLACERIPDTNERVEIMNIEGMVLGIIDNPEYYTPDIEYECYNTLNTKDENHPYVRYLTERAKKRPYYVGGEITFTNPMQPFHYDFLEYRYSREEILKETRKAPFLGFQTRNPMHKSHFYLTLYALSQTKKQTKLLLSPVVGPTQDGDVDYHIRMKTYIAIMDEYKKQNIDVIMCVLPLSMRMAGPREALHHTLIRQNIGCDFFIIGRDHAGPSIKTKDNTVFYEATAAQTFVKSFQPSLRISVLYCPAIVYSQKRSAYIPITDITEDDKVVSLSGTEQREILNKGMELPEWYTFKSISNILYKHIQQKKGVVVYVYGLSGSGKTTFVKSLQSRLYETTNRRISILDGDVVRLHLSKGLGFSKEDRSTNVQRIGFVASQIAYHGGICLCANIAPYEEDRILNRQLISMHSHYIEIYMNTPLNICENRDTKGLYENARKGIIKEFTGISDPFEPYMKIKSEFEFDGSDMSLLPSNLNQIVDYLHYNELI